MDLLEQNCGALPQTHLTMSPIVTSIMTLKSLSQCGTQYQNSLESNLYPDTTYNPSRVPLTTLHFLTSSYSLESASVSWFSCKPPGCGAEQTKCHVLYILYSVYTHMPIYYNVKLQINGEQNQNSKSYKA